MWHLDQMARRLLLVPALTMGMACGNDPSAPTVTSMSIQGGNEQVGGAGAALEPFEVLVADQNGTGLDGATIVWEVTSGEGLFRVEVGGEPGLVSSIANLTGMSGAGRARVEVVPLATGELEVTAFGTLPSGGAVTPVRFTATIDRVSVLLSEITDWAAPWPEGTGSMELELGTTVEWRSAEVCCAVRSLSVPAGGTPFSITITHSERTVTFVPDAVGEWTWEWERPDELAWWDWDGTLNDTATFVVR